MRSAIVSAVVAAIVAAGSSSAGVYFATRDSRSLAQLRCRVVAYEDGSTTWASAEDSYACLRSHGLPLAGIRGR